MMEPNLKLLKDGMKILVVFGYGNIFYPKAGNESRIHYLTEGLSKNNEVITLERKEFKKFYVKASFSKKRYFFNDVKIKNIHFGLFFSDINPWYILKIFEILKKENPHVIQISYPRGLLATRFCICLKKKKKPVLVYVAEDLQVEVGKINAEDPSIPYLQRHVTFLYDKIIEKIAVKVADHIICISSVDKRKFIEKYSLNPEKITVIPPTTKIPDLKSIDTKIECREKLGLSANKIIIMFHGVYNYLPNKEAVTFIEAYIAPKIGKIYKEVIFVIAGKGAPKTKKNNIIYLGFVEDLHSLIRSADLAIVPVLKGGGTRIKILDYMCMDIPIITTKKGIEGIEAKNYEHAIIVDDINQEFINAIRYLIDSEEERERIGANARKLAEEKYDGNKIGEKLDKLYSNLIGGIKRGNK